MKKLLILLLALLAPAAPARAERPRVYALTGARIMTAPGQVIDSGTIVLRDGLIESVGKQVSPPADAWVIDANGRTVTAGFIDACTDLGQKKPETGGGGGGGGTGGRQAEPRETPPGPNHPIARIHPERRAVDLLQIDATTFDKHRAMGFTSAVTMPGDGLFRGQAAVIDLNAGPPSSSIVRADAGQMLGFDYGGFGQGYPTSLMGAIAAIRQTLLDAQRETVWRTRYESDPTGLARPEFLEAFAPLEALAAGRTQAIFDVKDRGNITRAIAISREFILKAILIGSGGESVEQGAISALKRSGYPVILPLAFPDKPKVEDPDEALNVTFQDLEAWDAAPANPAKLQEAGIPIALGTCRLPAPGDFPGNLRKAIGRGLTEQAALAALTTAPAKFFGLEKSLGTLEAGKIANLVVFADAPAGGEGVFAEKSKPVQVFVDGVKYEIEQKKSKGDPNAKVDPRGTWSVVYTIGGRTLNRTWTLKGHEGSWSGSAETQAGVVDFVSVKLAGNELTVVLPPSGGRGSQEIVVVITGDTLEGSAELSSGGSFPVKGNRTSGPEGGAP